MRTIGFVLILLFVVISARFLGGTAGRIDAEQHRETAAAQTAEFLSEIDRFSNDSAHRAALARSAYLADIEASGWHSLFDANRIEKDTDLIDSMNIINRAKASLKKHEVEVYASIITGNRQIGSLNISISEKKAMLSGVDKGENISKQNLALERQVIEEAKSIILLLNSDDRWFVENNLVVFRDDRLRSDIASHFNKIDEISQLQHTVKAELLSSVGAGGAR